jgi:hypothetical protein
LLKEIYGLDPQLLIICFENHQFVF